jgi:hypothetical protein
MSTTYSSGRREGSGSMVLGRREPQMRGEYLVPAVGFVTQARLTTRKPSTRFHRIRAGALNQAEIDRLEHRLQNTISCSDQTRRHG